MPESTAIFFTQKRNISRVQPILEATDWVAPSGMSGHARWLRQGVLRSRTSFEYPDRLFIR